MTTPNFFATKTLAATVAVACLFSSQANAQFERSEEIMKPYQAGVNALQAEQWEEAIVAFDQAITADDGTFTQLYFGRAEALRELEDYQNAIVGYQTALNAENDFAPAYNGLGICYREMGNIEFAVNAFRNGAQLDRRDASLAANLGDVLVNYTQNVEEAMQHLDRAIEMNPDDAETYRNRGWGHTLLREFDEGIVDFQKAIELDPEDYETYQRLATLYLAEEDYQDGIDALSKAIEFYEPEQSSEPDSNINGYLQRAEGRMLLAKLQETSAKERNLLYEGVIEDTDAILREFPDRFPQSGVALHRRGMALRMQNKYEEAITAFTDAIQLIPPGNEATYTGEAYLLRGICWFYQGQNKLARGDFKEAASKSLEDPRPYLWIGYTQAEEQEFRKAIESYGEAAARNPSYSLAYANRGLSYMQLEDYDKAIDNFNEAIRAEPTEPKHFYKRGIAHEELGEWQKALHSYNLALLRDDQFQDAREGAARALRQLGRPNLGDLQENAVQ